jgi:hypothetical protein
MLGMKFHYVSTCAGVLGRMDPVENFSRIQAISPCPLSSLHKSVYLHNLGCSRRPVICCLPLSARLIRPRTHVPKHSFLCPSKHSPCQPRPLWIIFHSKSSITYFVSSPTMPWLCSTYHEISDRRTKIQVLARPGLSL